MASYIILQAFQPLNPVVTDVELLKVHQRRQTLQLHQAITLDKQEKERPGFLHTLWWLHIHTTKKSFVNTSVVHQNESHRSTWGAVRITPWYPKFNGNHFGLPSCSIHKMTGLDWGGGGGGGGQFRCERWSHGIMRTDPILLFTEVPVEVTAQTVFGTHTTT